MNVRHTTTVWSSLLDDMATPGAAGNRKGKLSGRIDHRLEPQSEIADLSKDCGIVTHAARAALIAAREAVKPADQ
jgi:hypothetical protein